MSLKAITIIAGSVTTIGGGLIFYLSNNSKNNTNNPLQKNVTPHKTVRSWTQITQSDEYKNAKTTGKLLNVISYKDEETADNNANYFLVEMKDPQNDLVWNNWEEITIKKDGSVSFEFGKVSGKDFGSIFYCFDQMNVSSIEELNFNNLKPCNSQPLKDKFLVISTSLDLKKSNLLFNKNFVKWHADKPSILIEVKISGSSTIKKHNAKVLKIFHKQYKPTISTNNDSTS